MKIKKFLNNREIRVKLIVTMVLLLLLILSFFFTSKIENFLGLKVNYYNNEVSKNEIEKSNFKVCYLDVGQGNATYVKLPDGKTMLIDGGNIPYSKKVIDKLKSENITKIDYLIATHADSDHIGTLPSVIDEFEVENIYRPFQIAGTGTNAEEFVVYEDEDLASVYEILQDKYNGNSKISRVTSNIYKDFITKIYNEKFEENGNLRNSNVTVFYDGLKISGDNYYFEFFSPLVRDDNVNLSDYTNTIGFATKGYGTDSSNDCSAIMLLSVFNEKFLFTGDASFSSGSDGVQNYEETDFINSLSNNEIEKFKNISVYLVGHHGSKYSSSNELLDIITPKFNVVSVSEDNNFGHPSNEVLEKLYNRRKGNDYLLMTKDSGVFNYCP